jgi:four helix bundle protein
VSDRIVSHRDLDVFTKAFDCAMQLFEVSRRFPKEETYSLTDQVRRSSRSVCANIAEAWRKRRYEAAFISKLSDAEAETAETQVWIEFAVKCGYLDRELGLPLFQSYDQILATLVGMINHPETWIITPR